MRKKVCFLAISLSLIAGYLIVLADSSGPTPGWNVMGSDYAYKTTNGFNLTAYVAHNWVKTTTHPLWNYRSYHWARAVGPDDTDFGVEFNCNGIQKHYLTTHEIDDNYDINESGGIWVFESTNLSCWDNDVPEWNGVSAYTAIWSDVDGHRNTDTCAQADVSGSTTEW